MALKTFVKISNVNNLSDARYCAGMYVHLMGFNLEEHNKNYLSPEKFREITEWLSGLKYVGEFENSHPDNILEIVRDYEEINYIQIREEAHLQMLVNTSYNLILKQQIRNEHDFQHLIAIAPNLKENNVVLLLESDYQHLPPEFIQPIREVAERTPVLLGFGIHADTVQDLLKQTKAKGIALMGGDEVKPGVTDFEGLADILEVLEINE